MSQRQVSLRLSATTAALLALLPAHGLADEGGCPDGKPLAAADPGKPVTSRVVYFATASATLSPESHRILDAIAEVMKRNEDIGRLRIEGHADDRDTAEHNLELSRARARSVMDYLIGRGVDPKRLDLAGYGEARPVQDVTPLLEELEKARGGRKAGLLRKLKEMRARNRRVEYVIVAPRPAREGEGLPRPAPHGAPPGEDRAAPARPVVEPEEKAVEGKGRTVETRKGEAVKGKGKAAKGKGKAAKGKGKAARGKGKAEKKPVP